MSNTELATAQTDVIARLMPDPFDPRRPGVLTPGELAACKRILTLVASRSVQALEITEWEAIDQRAHTMLHACGYVRSHDVARRSFAWCTLEITPAGRLYLQQVSA